MKIWQIMSLIRWLKDFSYLNSWVATFNRSWVFIKNISFKVSIIRWLKNFLVLNSWVTKWLMKLPESTSTRQTRQPNQVRRAYSDQQTGQASYYSASEMSDCTAESPTLQTQRNIFIGNDKRWLWNSVVRYLMTHRLHRHTLLSIRSVAEIRVKVV